MNNSDNDPQTIRRGPKTKASDSEMKELALKTKNKYSNKPLTYSLLEKETGIGRNTWKRRLENFIAELNNPIMRSFEGEGNEEIYFPNIESLFEKNSTNQQKIINELYKFEILFQELFKERNLLKKELASAEKAIIDLAEINEKLKEIQIQMNHYKNLYEEIMISSIEPHIRKEHGIKNNLLDFNATKEKSMELKNLGSNFPSQEIAHDMKNKKDKIDLLKNKFDHLF